MNLSDNFTLAELTKSQTAVRKGIRNEPSTEHINNLIHLARTILQPVREYFDEPVMISSGYRSPELCEAIGSSAKSQHDPNSGWVHCSAKTPPEEGRKQILQAKKIEGKTVYEPILL